MNTQCRRLLVNIGLWVICCGFGLGENDFSSVVSGQADGRVEQEQPIPSIEQRDRTLYVVDDAWRASSAQQRQMIDTVVLRAYQKVAMLGSSDLVLIREQVREEFLHDCAAILQSLDKADTTDTILEVNAAVYCWRLLTLRKAGKLPAAKGRIANTPITDHQRVVAEIASRRSEDHFQQSLDRILVDDQGRHFWAEAARQLSPDLDLDNARRAALALRKSRQLRPELSARLVNWPIEQKSHLFEELAGDLNLVPQQPGVYLFRDESGYLYIGEAKDLRARFSTHAKQPDRASLAVYLQQESTSAVYVDLHIFPADSPGNTLSVRRAYESELIRSRQPRFNLRP